MNKRFPDVRKMLSERSITMDKQTRIKEYKEMCSKYTDKQLLKELESMRKYMQTHSQYLDWGNLNPNDFSNNDRFIILRDIVKERNLEEL